MKHSWYAEPGVWAYAAAVLAFAWVAVRLLAQWRPGGKPAMLLAMALATAVAAAAAAAFAVAPSHAMWRILSILDWVRSAATIGFLLAFLGVREQVQRGGARWMVLIGVAVVVLVAQLLLGVDPPGSAEDPAVQLPGFAAELAAAVFGLVLIEQCYRRTPANSRWHVRPLLLGLGGLLAFDVVLYSDGLLFRVLDPNLWVARGLAQAVTVPLLLLTLQRTQDLSFALSLSRRVLEGTTALFAVGCYLLVLASAGFILRQFGGSWGRALESVLVFAALLFLAFVGSSATVRAKLKVQVAKHFFTYRYDYRAEWLRFTNTLTAGSAAQPWSACIQAMGDLVESTGGALWFRSADGTYRQVERIGVPTDLDLVPEKDPLPMFLRRTGWVIEVSDVVRQPAKYDGLRLPPQIANLREAWIVVPLSTAQELTGFVVLSTPRVRLDLDWEVLDLLKTAGRQAASYLAHAQATDALLEARKFDAFHRMSTFVVHDLKNLIAQLQLLLSNAERHRDNPDFQRDMLKTIEHVVGRMHQLTLQLRPEASAQDAARAVEVGAVVRRVQALRIDGRGELQVEADEGIFALAHEDLLERVISHLVQNAFDASGADPVVRLRVAREGDGVLIEVRDRGTGMTAEFMRERLFKPFQTTKRNGLGIGAFECQQYVVQVGGHIDVASAPDKGTAVRLHLRAVADAPAVVDIHL
ncbi:MAG: XrtA/PEP-CTERM system histidine kinase PrsK [Burkholderiaceae bacterium]